MTNITRPSFALLLCLPLLVTASGHGAFASDMVMTPTAQEDKENVTKTTTTVTPDAATTTAPAEASKVVEKKETVVTQTPAPAPAVEEEKYMVRDAITGKKVEQVSPFDVKKKETLRDQVRSKLKE